MASLRHTERSCGSGVEARVGLWGIILFPSKITRTDFYSLMMLVDIHFLEDINSRMVNSRNIFSFTINWCPSVRKSFVLFLGWQSLLGRILQFFFCCKDFMDCMISFHQKSIEQKCDNTVSLSVGFVLIWCKIICRCYKIVCMSYIPRSTLFKLVTFLQKKLLGGRDEISGNFFDEGNFVAPSKNSITFTDNKLCLEHMCILNSVTLWRIMT